jgi:hypothetical protein
METQITKSETHLRIIVDQNGLSKESSETLIAKFNPFLEQAKEWEDKAKTLIVTDVSQIAEMQQARDARLALKKIRINVENTRKDLKEDSLKTGKAIDGIANVLKGLIVTIEEHLEKQEKFAEIQQAEKAGKLRTARFELLQPYTENAHIYPLGQITEEAFTDLLNGFKAAAEKRISEEKKAKNDAIALEKKQVAERLRIQKENEALKKANEAKEKELAISKAKADAERKILEDKAAKERAASIAKLKEERDRNAKLQAEIKAKEDEQVRIHKALEAEAKAQLLAEKKAKRAPDKNKLLAFSDSLVDLERPVLNSIDAQVIMADIDNLIRKVVIFINEKTTNL